MLKQIINALGFAAGWNPFAETEGRWVQIINALGYAAGWEWVEEGGEGGNGSGGGSPLYKHTIGLLRGIVANQTLSGQEDGYISVAGYQYAGIQGAILLNLTKLFGIDLSGGPQFEGSKEFALQIRGLPLTSSGTQMDNFSMKIRLDPDGYLDFENMVNVPGATTGPVSQNNLVNMSKSNYMNAFNISKLAPHRSSGNGPPDFSSYDSGLAIADGASFLFIGINWNGLSSTTGMSQDMEIAIVEKNGF